MYSYQFDIIVPVFIILSKFIFFQGGFMQISYDYYRTFYYVAKLQSFTKAALALGGNQPNITRTIKNLEHTLGCTLFPLQSESRADARGRKALCPRVCGL